MRYSLLLPALGLVAAPVWAQSKHDTKAPINFAADHIELQDRANRALLTGAVRVIQAEMTLDAQRMTIAYRGQALGGASPQASRLDASGDVVVKRPDQTAHGDFGTYDLDKRTIVMVGAVTLTQGANTIHGSRLTMNLDTGRAVVDGSGVGGTGATAGRGGSGGGRVTGVFSVPQHDDAAKPAPPAAATPAPGGK